MSDSDAVLAANLEFYRAFAARDLAAMDALWARRAPVACLHPGWAALFDRAAIMRSWEGILSHPQVPRITCYDERVMLYGEAALVLCEEELEGATLAASNLFVRENGQWHLPPPGRPDRPPPDRTAPPSEPAQLDSGGMRAAGGRFSALRGAV